jgi:hypothetical protein
LPVYILTLVFLAFSISGFEISLVKGLNKIGSIFNSDFHERKRERESDNVCVGGTEHAEKKREQPY